MPLVSGRILRNRRRTSVGCARCGTSSSHLEGTAYVNHLATDDRPEQGAGVFGENYARLRAVKAKYDPRNLFRMNANITP